MHRRMKPRNVKVVVTTDAPRIRSVRVNVTTETTNIVCPYYVRDPKAEAEAESELNDD